MPSFYITSLFERRQRKYFPKIVRVRQELAELLDSFEAQVGKDAAGVVRAYAAIPCRHLARGDEPPEQQTVFSEVQRLKEKEAALTRKLHSPSCCYRERPKPPYVLWYYGTSWEDVRRLEEDGKLPLRHVLRLLDVLVNTKPDREVVGRKKVFRRRLIRFLRMAAKLEEDVARGM